MVGGHSMNWVDFQMGLRARSLPEVMSSRGTRHAGPFQRSDGFPRSEGRIHRDMQFRLLPMSKPADTNILDCQHACNSHSGLFDQPSYLWIGGIHQPVPHSRPLFQVTTKIVVPIRNPTNGSANGNPSLIPITPAITPNEVKPSTWECLRLLPTRLNESSAQPATSGVPPTRCPRNQ